MRRSADIQSDQEKLEQLASSRTELKTALQLLADDSSSAGTQTDDSENSSLSQNKGYFMATSSFTSSLFQLNRDDAELMLRDQLKTVEEEIVEVCSQIQRRLD